MRFLRKYLFGVVLTFALNAGVTYAGDIKPLAATSAAAILTSMGYMNVAVGAIIDGPVANTKIVLGVAVRDGAEKRIQETFEYDQTLGWFYYEFQETNGKGQAVNRDMPPMFGGGAVMHVKLRIWSLDGYKEVVVGGV